MLLGAQLIADGLCTTQDVEEAAHAQRRLGGRIGSALVELGALDLDELAVALGHQKRLPPALIHHFRMVDAPTLARLPKKIAEKFGAVPIGAPPAAPNQLVVAMIDPFAVGALDAIGFAVGARVVPLIAPELRILEALEKFYGSVHTDRNGVVRMLMPTRRTRPRPTSGRLATPQPMQAPGLAQMLAGLTMPTVPPPPTGTTPDAPSTLAVAPPEPSDTLPGRASSYLRSVTPPTRAAVRISTPRALSDLPPGELMSVPPPSHLASSNSESPLEIMGPATEPPLEVIGPVVDLPTNVVGASASGAFLSLEGASALAADEAITALAEAARKDDVTDALCGFLRTWFHSGLVLIVKDGAALGWRGFSMSTHGEVDTHVIEAISIPLAPPSMFRTAFQDKSRVHGPPSEEGAAVQGRLWKLLRCEPPTDLVVAPVVIGGRVVNLVAGFSSDQSAIGETALGELDAVLAAATAAYVSLIKKTR